MRYLEMTWTGSEATGVHHGWNGYLMQGHDSWEVQAVVGTRVVVEGASRHDLEWVKVCSNSTSEWQLKGDFK